MTGGASSARYIFISTIASRVFLLIAGIVLSRILSIEDFGYLLTLNIIFALANLFSISGYEYFFIQQTNIEKNKEIQLLRQVYNLRIIQVSIIFIILLLISGWLYFNGDTVLAQMLIISAFVFPVGLISKPEETWLSKNLNYHTISIASVIRDIIGSIVKIASALVGAGALSFSIGNLAGNTFYSIYIKYYKNINLFKKSNLRSKVVSYRKISIFSFHLFLNTSGSFLIKQMDKLLVASFFPKQIQGLYEFSGKYAAYPFNTLIAPQTSMVLSLLAKHHENTDYLLNLCKKYSFIAVGFLIPFLVFAYNYSHLLIGIVFGLKWVAAVPLFKVFIIYYILRILFFPANALLTSHGRPDLKAQITIIGALVTAVVLFVLIKNNAAIINYANAFVAISLITDFACIIRGFKLIDRSALQYFKFRIILVSPLLVLSGTHWMLNLHLNNWPIIIQLLIGLLTTVLFILIFIHTHANNIIDSVKLISKNQKLIKFLSFLGNIKPPIE